MMKMEQTTVGIANRGYRSGPLRKISAPDMHLAVELFVDAAVTLTPDDQTQRKAFEALLPHMYVLRNKGVSWAQLANLLSRAGINLQVSTVRTYYSEMLMRKFDACQERMNEQLVLLKAIKKGTEGFDMAAIANRVSSVAEKNRAAVAPRLAQILDEPAYAPRVPALSDAGRSDPPSRPSAQGPAARRPGPAAQKPPAPPPPRPGPEKRTTGHYGLTQGVSGTTSNGKQNSSAVGFQNPEDTDPSVPDLQSSVASGRQEQAPGRLAERTLPKGREPGKACMPLKQGIAPIKQRDGVPPHVYQECLLEHPAIPGLMLSLEHRLYGVLLEYKALDTGEVFMETTDEKRFRVLWKAPIPKTQTSTASSFIETDMSLFRPGEGSAK